MNSTSTSGGYVALVSIIVAAAAHYGIVVDPDSITTAIAGIVSLVGLVHLLYQHFKLKTTAVAAGIIKR